jgi:hypothetical protein
VGHRLGIQDALAAEELERLTRLAPSSGQVPGCQAGHSPRVPAQHQKCGVGQRGGGRDRLVHVLGARRVVVQREEQLAQEELGVRGGTQIVGGLGLGERLMQHLSSLSIESQLPA